MPILLKDGAPYPGQAREAATDVPVYWSGEVSSAASLAAFRPFSAETRRVGSAGFLSRETCGS